MPQAYGRPGRYRVDGERPSARSEAFKVYLDPV
jgi:hypothetical protein